MSTPRPCILTPVTIAAANNQFSFQASGNQANQNYIATVTAATYQHVRAYLDALMTAMGTADTDTDAATYSYAINTTTDASLGIVTITRSAGTWFPRFTGDVANTDADDTNNSAETAAVGTILGYDTGSNPGAAPSQAGYVQHQYLTGGAWYGLVPVASDSYDRLEKRRVHTTSLAGQNKLVTFGSVTVRDIRLHFVTGAKALITRETTAGHALENIWSSYPDRFTYYSDMTDTATAGQYFLRQSDELERFFAERQYPALEVYEIPWPMQAYVA